VIILTIRAVQGVVTNKPALLIGIRGHFANIPTQLKKNSFVEPTKIGLDKALLRGACTLDPEVEGTGVCQVPRGKKSYGIRNPLHSTLDKGEVLFRQIT
jgi:hypothetical protein